MLGSTLLEVDLDRILQSIHEYFEELGMAEIRKRQVNQKHLLAPIHSKCFSPVHLIQVISARQLKCESK